MELIFREEDGKFVAEFTATSDFNLHLERKDKGSLALYQTGSQSGQYVEAYVVSGMLGEKVIDTDFGALVYPKYIKVVSGSKVNIATVTFA